MSLRSVALAALVAAAPAPAAAHEVVSVDVNNRYLKLTPMADRVRLAYTILVGEEPGRVARQALDRDGDRTISAGEADAWAARVAGQIRGQLTVEIDGQPVAVDWSEVFAGFDDRAVDAGTFSLDLIAWLCAPSPGPRHRIHLVDRSTLEPAGETEIRIAGDTGVTLEGRMAGRRELTLEGSSPLAGGIEIVYTAREATRFADGRCPAPARSRPSRWPLVLGGLLALLGVAALVWRLRR